MGGRTKSHLTPTLPLKKPRDCACDWTCDASSRAKCIRCCYCDAFFSPNKFIFHYHRTSDSALPAVYNHPDAANFNSWRRHLKLVVSTLSSSPLDVESRLHAWEDVKAMFNGGSRRRIHHQHQQHVRLSLAVLTSVQCWGLSMIHVSWYVSWCQKSIMIHPQRSISISITDTFGEYRYHKKLIHQIWYILNDS